MYCQVTVCVFLRRSRTARMRGLGSIRLDVGRSTAGQHEWNRAVCWYFLVSVHSKITDVDKRGSVHSEWDGNDSEDLKSKNIVRAPLCNGPDARASSNFYFFGIRKPGKTRRRLPIFKARCGVCAKLAIYIKMTCDSCPTPPDGDVLIQRIRNAALCP